MASTIDLCPDWCISRYLEWYTLPCIRYVQGVDQWCFWAPVICRVGGSLMPGAK
jgi:hypothetical protein